MVSGMPNIDAEALITAVAARPALWQAKHKDNKNKPRKQTLWDEVAAAVAPGVAGGEIDEVIMTSHNGCLVLSCRHVITSNGQLVKNSYILLGSFLSVDCVTEPVQSCTERERDLITCIIAAKAMSRRLKAEAYEVFIRESDLALGPFFPATERLGIAKPCAMVYVEELRILAGRTASQETSVFGYILAFDWMRRKHHLPPSTYHRLPAFAASPHVPKLAGPRFLSAVWWIAVVVLMNAFCGHMRACLMIKPEVEKIESAQHLVRRPHVVPHMWLGTSYVSMVSGSSNPDLRQIGRTIRERRTAVPTSVLYGESLLRQVTRGRAAIISDSMSLTFRVTAVCQAFVGAEFYLAREGVVSHPLNSLARKDIDPVMFKDINKGIQRLLEAGLIDLWFSRAKGDVGRCRGSSTSSGEPDLASPLALTDVFGVFVLWMACIGISCLFFVAEACARCTQKTACHFAPKPADRGRHRWHARVGVQLVWQNYGGDDHPSVFASAVPALFSRMQGCIHAGDAHSFSCVLDGTLVPRDEPLPSNQCDAEAVFALKVKCWNSPYGCIFVGPLADLLGHFERGCGFHTVICQRCHTRVLLARLPVHCKSGCRDLGESQAGAWRPAGNVVSHGSQELMHDTLASLESRMNELVECVKGVDSKSSFLVSSFGEARELLKALASTGSGPGVQSTVGDSVPAHANCVSDPEVLQTPSEQKRLHAAISSLGEWSLMPADSVACLEPTWTHSRAARLKLQGSGYCHYGSNRFEAMCRRGFVVGDDTVKFRVTLVRKWTAPPAPPVGRAQSLNLGDKVET
ncbi:hypothetical protein HPB48_017039 [Haemaphysalis longicornis]|uniref:Uncharacterized protein n=1 Tax=Haemaphysalis longicornis TaxID=44386 RepID=A0A9J6FKT5_HAELO|nr:hypothetical protein HPB48_017039 [Haemaphysalis longicornis]